jgi:hypothetical protein
MISRIALGIILLGIPVSASSSPPVINLPGNAKLPANWFSWAKEPWTGDNTPYHAARLQIEHAKKMPGKLNELETRYERAWHADPDDPLAFYRWGYTKYLQILQKQSLPPQYDELAPVNNAFDTVPSPHTRDYDRFRYLVGEYFTPHAETANLAQRLLRSDPNDYNVGYALASSYLYVYNPARILDALKICDMLKRVKPTEAATYSTIGFAYVMWYSHDQNPANARAVVANYQKYLELAPPDAFFRKRAEQIIAQFKPKMDR